MDRTEHNLRELPQSKGFRLRGEQMTRLETFADAAIATGRQWRHTAGREGRERLLCRHTAAITD